MPKFEVSLKPVCLGYEMDPLLKWSLVFTCISSQQHIGGNRVNDLNDPSIIAPYHFGSPTKNFIPNVLKLFVLYQDGPSVTDSVTSDHAMVT